MRRFSNSMQASFAPTLNGSPWVRHGTSCAQRGLRSQAGRFRTTRLGPRMSVTPKVPLLQCAQRYREGAVTGDHAARSAALAEMAHMIDDDILGAGRATLAASLTAVEAGTPKRRGRSYSRGNPPRGDDRNLERLAPARTRRLAERQRRLAPRAPGQPALPQR